VVSVKKSGQHVTNSPFKILVGQSEIGDASRVKVWGKGLVEGHTFEMSEFIVDTRSAGETTLPGGHGWGSRCGHGWDGVVAMDKMVVARMRWWPWP